MIRRLLARFRKAVIDPALDVLGGIATGLYAGRTALFATASYTFVMAGSILPAAALVGVMVLDGYTHISILSRLRDLMRFEVLNELYAGKLRLQMMAI